MKAFLTIVLVTTAVVASRYHLRRNYWNAPFLKNVSKEGRIEYGKIIADWNLTTVQEQEKIAAWAKKYNLTEEVKKFIDKMNDDMKHLKQHLSKLIASLPAAHEEYMKITENKDKTLVEIKQELSKMRAKNPEVYSLVRHVIWHYKEHHMQHHKHHRRRRRWWWLRARMILLKNPTGKSKEKTSSTKEPTKNSGSKVKNQ